MANSSGEWRAYCLEAAMAFVETEDSLWSELASIAQDEGLLLYDVERKGVNSIRVFVSRKPVLDDLPLDDEQSAGKQAGVTSDDCSRLCRRLLVFFAADGERFGIASEPEIEVSSPGVNRHLRLAEHYSGALGERVKVLTEQKQGVVKGLLAGVDGEQISVLDEEREIKLDISFSSIKKARVDFSF